MASTLVSFLLFVALTPDTDLSANLNPACVTLPTASKIVSCETPARDEVTPQELEPAQRGRAAQRGNGQGRGGGQGRGRRGQQEDEQRTQADQSLFMFLIENREKIKRTVTKRDDGVETLTESDDPKVAKAIQDHVKSMYNRVENQAGIHLRDPLFRAIFSVTKEIKMQAELTEKGVHVLETSANANVVKLIQAHAEVVSLFIKNGRDEVQKNHDVPK